MSLFFQKYKSTKDTDSVDAEISYPSFPIPADLPKEMTEYRETLILLIRRLETLIAFNKDVIDSILSYLAHLDAVEEDSSDDAASEVLVTSSIPDVTLVQCPQNDQNMKKNVMQNILALVALSQNTFDLIVTKTKELDRLDDNIQKLFAALPESSSDDGFTPADDIYNINIVDNYFLAGDHLIKPDFDRDSTRQGAIDAQNVVITAQATVDEVVTSTVQGFVHDSDDDENVEDDLSWEDSTESDSDMGFDFML